MSIEDYARLYGLDYHGRTRSEGKMVHRFTDLLTGNTLLVRNQAHLATAVLANRESAFDGLVKRRARDRAVQLSELFHGYKARFEREIEIDWPKSLTTLGICARVDYFAEKSDEDLARFWHEFKNPVMLYAAPEPQVDGTQLLVIHGKFEIRSEGITG